jgi:WD40 repeat protein
VLAAGGSANGGFLSSAELFDPSTGAWNFTGSMHDQRWIAAAVLLPDGKVLVAGGANNVSNFAPVRTAELYNQATGIWTPTGSMNHERRAFTLTLLPNGKVMAVGGSDTNGPLVSVELYDPTTGIWTPTSSLQSPRDSHTATLLPNGTVLVAGGLGGIQTQSVPPVDPVVASAEIYDPATGQWTPTGSMGQAREAHTATLLTNGKVLVAGGESFFGGLFPTGAEVYDPSTGKWSPTLPLTSGRSDHIATLLPNGKVLIAGGFNTSDTGPSTELFDPASAVAAPFLLSQPTKLATGAFQFTFRNTPGINFTVLSTANLGLGVNEWTSAATPTEVSPGHYLFTDATTDAPSRFYIVRSQ